MITKFRKSDIILNYKKFFQNFDNTAPNPCTCGSHSPDPADHLLLFPCDLQPADRVTLRNLNEPTYCSNTTAANHIIPILTNLLLRLRSLKLRRQRNSPIIITLYKQAFILKTNKSNVCLSLTSLRKIFSELQLSNLQPDDLKSYHKALSTIIDDPILTDSIITNYYDHLYPKHLFYVWILTHFAFVNGLPQRTLHRIIILYNNSILHNNSKHQSNQALYSLKQRYQNHIFIPIDKNARQCAIICPARLHHYTRQTFISDEKHFQLLPRSTSIAQIHKHIQSQLLPSWFPETRKQTTTIPNLFLILKADERVRPLGSFAPYCYIKELKIASRALNAILTTTPLKHFMIFNSTHLKDIIKRFNDLATYYNFIISNFNFDVKNFYTEIDKDSLLRKLAFVINLYIQTHHSNVISISKYDKKLPPITGTTNDPNYYSININLLHKVLIFALNNAYFTLGLELIKQIHGLPMG